MLTPALSHQIARARAVISVNEEVEVQRCKVKAERYGVSMSSWTGHSNKAARRKKRVPNAIVESDAQTHTRYLKFSLPQLLLTPRQESFTERKRREVSR